MRVKGSVLKSRTLFASARGPESLKQYLAALSPETRKHAENGFLVSSWYPMEMFTEMNTVADRVFGHGDLALCLELGRYGCDATLNSLYRMFIRLGSVSYIIKRAAQAWKTHYDGGELVVVEETDHSVTLEIRSVDTPHPSLCLAVRGWIARAGELSGARNVQSHEEKCVLHGAPACSIHLTWQ